MEEEEACGAVAWAGAGKPGPAEQQCPVLMHALVFPWEKRDRLAWGECRCGSCSYADGGMQPVPPMVAVGCLPWAHATFASHGPQPFNVPGQVPCQKTPQTHV